MNDHHYMVLVYLVALFMAVTVAITNKVFGAECAPPQVVNTTPVWDERDESTFRSASQGGCARHFPDMPCLKIFIKKAEHSYSAICGPVKK